MKLWKWHTIVFRCPCCGKDSDHAAQVIEGKWKGTYFNPTYWCERCEKPARARDTWAFGAVFGPLLAMVGVLAVEAIPVTWGIPHPVAVGFAAVCCLVVGWPLSRTLSRHLLFWEPREPGALQQAQLRRMREDEE